MLLLLLLKNRQWDLYTGRSCSAKETVFGSLPNFCYPERRSGLNRISHTDWVKLCVESSYAPNQNTKFPSVTYLFICSRRYFALVRNLIRCIISPNQDDLSYSTRGLLSGQQKLGKLPNTVSLAEQLRPVQTSHWRLFNSSSSMNTWGNLSNLWSPCV